MDLLILVIVACIIGFVVYLLTTRIPMPAGWASAIQVIAGIALLLWLIFRVAGNRIPNVL